MFKNLLIKGDNLIVIAYPAKIEKVYLLGVSKKKLTVEMFVPPAEKKNYSAYSSSIIGTLDKRLTN